MQQPPYAPYPEGVTPRRQTSPWTIVALVLGGCAVLGLGGAVVLAALLFPVFSNAREAARTASCQSNLKQISMALLMYTQDNDQKLPPANEWQDGLSAYARNPQLYACPSALQLPVGYAYNSVLSGRSVSKVASAAQVPALYDSILGIRNGSDQLQSFAPRHRRSTPAGVMAFLDGHVTSLAQQQVPSATTGLGGG